jgi:MFS family permease
MAGIFALAAAFVFSQFYRSCLAVLTPILSVELGASKADFSIASGAWYLSFAICQFAVGIWLDRHGPRWTASLLFAIAAVGAFVFAAASAPWMLVLAMALIGIGCSAILMSGVYIIARNYPPARMAVLSSWFVAFGSAGNVIGTSPLAAAAEAFGWRSVIAGLGFATFLAAVAIAVLVRNPEKAAGGRPAGLSGYGELLRIRALWPMFPMMLLGFTAATGIRGLWVGPYITDVFEVDPVTMGNVSLALALSMVTGTFLYGPMDTIFNTRKWVIVTGQCICALALVTLAINVNAGLLAATALLVVIGVAGMGMGMATAHGREYFPPHLIGRGVTLLNFCSIGGVGVMQFVTGRLVAANTRPDDPAHAYSMLFFFYAAMIVVTLLIYLRSKDVPPLGPR